MHCDMPVSESVAVYVLQVGLVPSAPHEGSIEDLEGMGLQQKIQHLRGHHEWKCQKKKELLAEHERTWRNNGLADLGDIGAMVQSDEALNAVCSKIRVDIGLSPGQHWSNAEVALDFTVRY